MPQMKPLLWLIMIFFPLFSMILISSFIFFNQPFSFNLSSSPSSMLTYWNWKW